MHCSTGLASEQSYGVHFMIKLVVLIADCVRPRAPSIGLKQARKVLDLRGALTFQWAAQS